MFLFSVTRAPLSVKCVNNSFSCTIFLLSTLGPVFQILAPKSHMVTKLTVQWSVFTTCWSENAVPKYSDGNVCNLFQFYKCKRRSGEKTKSRSQQEKTLYYLFSVYWSHTRHWETALSFNIFDFTRFIPGMVLVLGQMAEYTVRSAKFLFKLMKTVNIHKTALSGESVLNS